MTRRSQLNSLLILGIYCLTMTLASLLANIFNNGDIYYPLLTVLNTLGCVAMFFVTYKYPSKDRFMLKRKPTNWLSVTLYIVLGAVCLLLVQWICMYLEIHLLRQASYSANTSYLLAVFSKYPYYILNICLFAPIMEEFVFRKVLFAESTAMISPVGAALISSLLFSLAHQDGHFLTYACIGLTLCALYAKTGRLETTIGAHILMNIAVVLMAL